MPTLLLFLALPRDESIPPGRRVEDTSRHHRGRPSLAGATSVLSLWLSTVD